MRVLGAGQREMGRFSNRTLIIAGALLILVGVAGLSGKLPLSRLAAGRPGGAVQGGHASLSPQHAAPALESAGGGCAAASLSPAMSSVQAGSTVALVANSSGCPSPLYTFWVLGHDSVWRRMPSIDGAVLNWDTSGYLPGSYVVHVWAGTQRGSHDSIGSALVMVTGCRSASVTPASGSARRGTVVNFRATSSGCSGPSYAFWIQYPDGSWHQARSFGGSAFSWSTAGLPAGRYTIHAWASTQSTGHDAIGTATYVLT